MKKQHGILWLSLVDQDLDRLGMKIPIIFPEKPNHFHVTLQYNVKLTDEISQFLWKDPLQVQVTSNCYNSRIQAVRVKLPDPFREICQNANPHMTISMALGSRPVQSNIMLDSLHVAEPLAETLPFIAQFHHFS